MNNNPHLNPYNLRIRTTIRMPGSDSGESFYLKEQMREVWEQHVFWTRLLIVSIVEHLKDEEETTKRLLKNPKDLAAIYRPFYGDSVANLIDKLITEHLVIGAKLIHAVNDNSPDANKLNDEWYKNADEIAEALSSLNPYYKKDELKHMLYTHLDLTKEEVTNRINHNYSKEIDTFDKAEKEILMMSDYLSQEISSQFI